MTDKTDKQPDFEKALAELESLVQKMESGDLTLDDSLAEFKRGVELTRHCQDVLEKAQLTVDKLLNVDDESSTEPFKPDS